LSEKDGEGGKLDELEDNCRLEEERRGGERNV